MLTDPRRVDAVAAAAAAAADPCAALDRLTDVAARLLHARWAFLSLVGEDLQLFVASSGPSAPGLPPQLPTGSSVCRRLVEDGGLLLVPDLRSDPVLRELVEVRHLGMRSYAGAAVVSRDGRVLGGLCVADDVPRDWTAEEGALLADLAGAASSELAALVRVEELARAHDDEHRRAEEQTALHRVAASVVRGTLPQRVLQQAADELVPLLGATAALVLRFRPDGGTSVVVASGPVQAATSAWSWYGRLMRGVPRPAAVLGGEDQPCAAVPITVGGRTWGALVVVLGDEGSQGQVEHLEQLGDFLALVLTNAEAQLQLTRLAHTDPLTGAPNRRVFEERLALELDRCRDDGECLLVALLDVDLFKEVNDRHGHVAGDAVLRALAERVGDLLGEDDLLARLGGDEWAILVPSCDAPREVLERVREAVAGAPLAGVDVTVTLGGVVVRATDAPAQVLRRADTALYRAKTGGRDRVDLTELDEVS